MNEPETSLHPELSPPLGRLIAQRSGAHAGAGCHARAELIASLNEQDGCDSVTLEKDLKETRISGLDKLDLPVWRWASR